MTIWRPRPSGIGSSNGRSVWPDVGAVGAARAANKSRFKIGQPNVIRPSVPADLRRVAALEVGAIDQEATNARRSHFPEGDFLVAAFHVSKSIRLCCQIGRD
jgi:hypothetical protein